MNRALISKVSKNHTERFGVSASVMAYAPGRIEVLGNHTDYNEGFTLSSAINMGIVAAVSPTDERKLRLNALDAKEFISLDMPIIKPVKKPIWVNYIAGVLAELYAFGLSRNSGGFDITIAGDIPMGSGLSSSAALETAASFAFCALAGITLSPIQTARICQAAEHNFVGTKCGLLDHISSLFGKADSLIFCDFRSLHTETDIIGKDVCFLMVNTMVKHSLVDSEYNERRGCCEKAAKFFASKLDHPVKALRDVSLEEFRRLSPELDPVVARRAAHIIGENDRVLEGRKLLQTGDIKSFGELMFKSHKSSQFNFENSCAELDAIVQEARDLKMVSGARLSGGGFGGSVVILVHPDDAAETTEIIADRYKKKFSTSCDISVIKPADGARLLHENSSASSA